jgi:hypothetical protein
MEEARLPNWFWGVKPRLFLGAVDWPMPVTMLGCGIALFDIGIEECRFLFSGIFLYRLEAVWGGCIPCWEF